MRKSRHLYRQEDVYSIVDMHQPTLLTGLTGVYSRELNLSGNSLAPAARLAVGTMLASLIVGAGATLECFHVRSCNFGDDGARPLFQAVAASTSLSKLIYSNIGISAACAR